MPGELALRIAAGDAAAEGEFAREFSRRLFLMMLARTRDPDTARDLAQDALLTALAALRRGQLHDPEKLPAFVLGIARHVASSHFREARRRVTTTLLHEAHDGSVAGAIARASAIPDDESSEHRTLARLALAVLNDEERQILRLSLVEEWTSQRIGERMNLAGDAVRARKSRALKRLAARIQEMSHPGPARPHSGGG